MIGSDKAITQKIVGIVLAFSLTCAGAAPDIESPEFSANPYLEGIRVVPAWTAGLLGAGIVIANLDTGVRNTHVDLIGRIAAGGYDFVNDDKNPWDDDSTPTNGHGTASSAVISGNWNGAVVGGIAPLSKILPIKVADDRQNTSEKLITDGIYHALDQKSAKIILIEALGRNRNLTFEDITPFKDAVAKGRLLIVPAGNGGQSGPYQPGSFFNQLGNAALVVGSHTGDKLSHFSNGAAGVMNKFITAPGENVLVAGNRSDTDSSRVSGTSMAAPQVAAAAALIWSHSPKLTAKQVAEILKSTATDLGSPGIDSVFGVGALNIERALAPIGIVVAPVPEEPEEEDGENTDDADSAEGGEGAGDATGDGAQEGPGNGGSGSSSGGSSGGGAGVAVAALVVGGVGYALVKNNPDLGETLILDEYGRTYELDLETRVSVRKPGPDARSVLQDLDSKQETETLIQRSDFKMTMAYTTTQLGADEMSDPFSVDMKDRPIAMNMVAESQDGFSYALGVNQSLSFFEQQIENSGSAANLAYAFKSDAFASPLYGFTNIGYQGAVDFRTKTGWRSGASFAFVDDNQDYGLKSESSKLRLGYQSQAAGLNFHFGVLQEEGNLLGGASNGALSVSRAQTVYGSVRGHLDLGHDWSIVGQYLHGLTSAKDAENSLIQDFSQIESNGWGMGLIGRQIVARDDAFGVAISQPLRTVDGDAYVRVPYWNRASGTVGFKTNRTSLVPSGSETSLEIFYRKPISHSAEMLSYFVHREQVLHQVGSGARTSMAVAISWRLGQTRH